MKILSTKTPVANTHRAHLHPAILSIESKNDKIVIRYEDGKEVALYVKLNQLRKRLNNAHRKSISRTPEKEG